MTPAEFAAATKRVADEEGRAYLRSRDKDDLRKLGMTDLDIAKARAVAAMTPEDRKILGLPKAPAIRSRR